MNHIELEQVKLKKEISTTRKYLEVGKNGIPIQYILDNLKCQRHPLHMFSHTLINWQELEAYNLESGQQN